MALNLNLGASPRAPLLQRTAAGWRLVQHGTVLSEVLHRAGPTHSVFDLLAAAANLLHPDARHIALLGFGGGGTLAALRALGCQARLRGIDLDPTGHDLVRRAGVDWLEPFDWHETDAVRWLRRTRRRFDVLLEDLSVPDASDVVKPAATWNELPALAARRLQPDGLAIFNLLPPTDETWRAGLDRIRAHFRHAALLHLPEYHNRVLLLRHSVPFPDQLRSRLARRLGDLGSQLKL